jgi:DNA-binding SARP family transcriptional activator/tetratricopeptide (TPR) repeat protein/DNA-binding XRE family transcriptional regulator
MNAFGGEHCAASASARGSADGGFGTLVRDRRRASGLTQQQLAVAAGVSVGAVRDLEQDRTARPHPETAGRLRAALGLGPDQPGDRAGRSAGEGDRRAENGEGCHGAVRVSVLGPLAAWRGGVRAELGPARQRAVLGLLAVRPGVALHRDAIVEALWDGDPPDSAIKMVQGYVGRLRQQLDPGRSPGDRAGVLVSAGTRYQLHAGAGQFDVITFGQLTGAALAARRSGDVPAACEMYAQALSLWRGTPLADLDLLSGHPAVTGLARRHAEVVTDFAETAIEAGLPDRVLPHLRALADSDPLDERAHALLMLALAGTGQQAAALAVYDRSRRRLDEEFGIGPGAELVRAHERVLRQEVPAARSRQAWAVTAAAAGPPRQLPRDPGVFVGREPELAALQALAERAAGAAAICVIDGGAGVGKTALAIHAGHRLAALFPDGQLHVDLRGFGPRQPPMPPAEALTGFLRALGTSPQAIPAAVEEQAAMFRSRLAGKRMLIVLDNAAGPGQVRPLLPGAPGCLALVTSRGRLPGLAARDGAARLTLGPLGRGEAALLLAAVLGPARVAAEPQAAAEISARCGLLPLALRIAADRAASSPRLALSSLAGQLAAARDRLDVLDAGQDDATAIRAVFSWSYKALAADAARMFRLLGVCTGPDIGAPAAAALAGAGQAQARRLLELLAGAHLVEEYVPGRYRLHDLLRAYAAEQAQAGETPDGRRSALRRMLTWYVHTADRADGLLVPGRRHPTAAPAPPGCEPFALTGYQQALAWCDAEYANLTAAIRLAAGTGHDDLAWKFPVAMRGFFDLRRPWAEWLACATIAVAAARRCGDRSGQAWALDCLGHAYSGLGRLDDALECYLQARDLRRETGDQWGVSANSTNNIGCTYIDMGKFDLALDCFQQVLATSRSGGSRYLETLALRNLGQAYAGLGRASEALACSRQATQAARQIGYPYVERMALADLARTYRALRNPSQARGCYWQALAVCRQSGDLPGEAETLRDLGDLSATTGHHQTAHQLWHQALVIADGLGDTGMATAIRGRLGHNPEYVRLRHADTEGVLR